MGTFFVLLFQNMLTNPVILQIVFVWRNYFSSLLRTNNTRDERNVADGTNANARAFCLVQRTFSILHDIILQ